MSVRRLEIRFDARAQRLHGKETAIELRPKSLAVLRLLAERAGELVTKEEIL